VDMELSLTASSPAIEMNLEQPVEQAANAPHKRSKKRKSTEPKLRALCVSVDPTGE